MPGDRDRTVYVGNLDERVNDRVLYEILIQAGRVIDLYIPRDKETNRHKGFAFAEYENEESAGYAVKLFTGLVTLYNRTLKFAISGQDKPPQNSGTSMVLASNSLPKPKSQPMQIENRKITQQPAQLLTPCRYSAHSESPSSRFPEHPNSVSPYYPKASPPGWVGNGYGSDFKGNSFDYDNCASWSALDNHGRALCNSRDSVPYSLDAVRYEAYSSQGRYSSSRSEINSRTGMYSSGRYEFHSSQAMYNSRDPIPYASY